MQVIAEMQELSYYECRAKECIETAIAWRCKEAKKKTSYTIEYVGCLIMAIRLLVLAIFEKEKP